MTIVRLPSFGTGVKALNTGTALQVRAPSGKLASLAGNLRSIGADVRSSVTAGKEKAEKHAEQNISQLIDVQI